MSRLALILFAVACTNDPVAPPDETDETGDAPPFALEVRSATLFDGPEGPMGFLTDRPGGCDEIRGLEREADWGTSRVIAFQVDPERTMPMSCGLGRRSEDFCALAWFGQFGVGRSAVSAEDGTFEFEEIDASSVRVRIEARLPYDPPESLGCDFETGVCTCERVDGTECTCEPAPDEDECCLRGVREGTVIVEAVMERCGALGM